MEEKELTKYGSKKDEDGEDGKAGTDYQEERRLEEEV